MTKFEKSCIEAICESPMAFELFRKRAYNVKRVDQFVNKIWPYKSRLNKKTKKKDELKAVRRIRNILYEEALIPQDDSSTTTYEFNYSANQLRREIRMIGKNTKSEILYPSADNILSICDEDWDTITQLSGRRRVSVSSILNDILESNIFNSKKIYINRRYGRHYSKELLMHVVSMFDKVLNKKTNYKPTYLNVGIEIEYEGIDLNYFEKELIKNKAVSFNSGYDGNLVGRLRENRLRISGISGLSALKLLLIEMEANLCLLDNHSGIHYHIDCSHRDPERILYKENSRKILSLLGDYSREVNDIFGSNSGNVAMYLSDRIRIPDEFETLEWRMIYPSLNYTLMVSQMLFCIYMTKIATSYNEKNPPKIDGEYLSLLANISKKIIAKIEQR